MNASPELQSVAPGLAIWQAFDASAKADLFSTAVRCPRGTLLVDPIPLAGGARDELLALGPVVQIVVTNANHWRSSVAWAEALNIGISGHISLAETATPDFTPLAHGHRILETIEVIVVEGAAPGEIALHHPGQSGSLILGDALIHFPPYGFTFLPAKYCTDHKRMRQSLRQLLDYKAERILFAHGTPILSKARSRLEELLNDG